MNNDLARRVAAALSEASTTVKAHTRRSKKGKVFNVRQYNRDLKNMSTRELNAIWTDLAHKSGDKAKTMRHNVWKEMLRRNRLKRSAAAVRREKGVTSSGAPTLSMSMKKAVYKVLTDNGPDVDMYSRSFSSMASKVNKIVKGKTDSKSIYAALKKLGMFGPRSDKLRGEGDKYY